MELLQRFHGCIRPNGGFQLSPTPGSNTWSSSRGSTAVSAPTELPRGDGSAQAPRSPPQGHSPGPRSFLLLLALAAAVPRARAEAPGLRSSCGITVPFRPGDNRVSLKTSPHSPQGHSDHPRHPKCPQGTSTLPGGSFGGEGGFYPAPIVPSEGVFTLDSVGLLGCSFGVQNPLNGVNAAVGGV